MSQTKQEPEVVCLPLSIKIANRAVVLRIFLAKNAFCGYECSHILGMLWNMAFFQKQCFGRYCPSLATYKHTKKVKSDWALSVRCLLIPQHKKILYISNAPVEMHTPHLCAGQHWQVCFRQEILCWGVGAILPDTPLQQSVHSGPWPGEWGPASCLGMLHDAIAPQSPMPAPTAERTRMTNRRRHTNTVT